VARRRTLIAEELACGGGVVESDGEERSEGGIVGPQRRQLCACGHVSDPFLFSTLSSVALLAYAWQAVLHPNYLMRRYRTAFSARQVAYI
jgi:hypothetical protein